MRNQGAILAVVVILAVGYGYINNPQACRKLIEDMKTDIHLIFTSDASPASA